MNQTNPRILTEDTIRKAKLKLTTNYNPEHLLQWAHSANFQMIVEIKARKREWQAVLKDGKEGREAKFEVRTPWSDPTDCMDALIATIYYDPHSGLGVDYTFSITERFFAIGLCGSYVVESPLFHCATEQQLIDYLDDDETPFKRYLHLEHIMEQMQNSERGREMGRQLRAQQKEKARREQNAQNTDTTPTYEQLCSDQYRQHPYETRDLDEQMSMVRQSIGGWWKPRFLIDRRHKSVCEFMDESEHLLTITDDDIDWGSLNGLPANLIQRVRDRNGHFPVLISHFHDGNAGVQWQINPDGRYFMDDDGFGMTDDEEITLTGTIDRTGRVIIKFCYKR
ncbi:MAG: hypothetical protein IJ814_07835 [Paludibacteraceae bacterium]|nr:hypothetical protein [Paludibacteraceae bacterium]